MKTTQFPHSARRKGQNLRAHASTASAHAQVATDVPNFMAEYVNMGVDQKVLARSYASGDHLSWLKSLREGSVMEFAKEIYIYMFRERFRVGWHACALTYLQTPPPFR